MALGTVEVPAYLSAQQTASSPRTGRTLVLCFDGTGDKFDATNSNVVKLFEALKKSDPTQLVYYQSGIGTYSGRSKLQSGISAALDMAVGSGLGEHVRQGYRFLMQNYVSGDKINLFGFSRGAYTARALAGMLHKVGLLPAWNSEQIPFAYQLYKDMTDLAWDLSSQFKKGFCVDVIINFCGVWDTVSSVGAIPRAELPFSNSANPSIRYFRQALALDERRAKFGSNDFIARLNDESTREIHTNDTDHEKHVETTECEHEFEFAETQPKRAWKTDVHEAWFVGAHCDVGGGAARNHVRHQLSRIPLRWMVRAAFECDTGILLHSKALLSFGLRIPKLYPKLIPRSLPVTASPAPSLLDASAAGTLPAAGSEMEGPPLDEDVEDYFDAISPINDQLKIAKWWWILEVLLRVKKATQKEDGVWYYRESPNYGRYRPVTSERPNMHYSVKMRQAELGYQIRNEVDFEAIWNYVM